MASFRPDPRRSRCSPWPARWSSQICGGRPQRLSSMSAIHNHDRMDDTEASLQAENAELRRLLEKHQWAGLVPVKSSGCCPECCGSEPPRGGGHRPGCAIATILVVSTPHEL